MIGRLKRFVLGVPLGWFHEALDAAFCAGKAIGVAEERVRWIERAEDPDEIEVAAATAAIDQAMAASNDLDRLGSSA